MKHLNISVEGKVQGVWFRKSTMEKARSLGLKGFVRNEPDGSVHIEAEGEPDDLEELVEWCHEGSDAAKVDKVSSKEGKMKHYKDFSIAY